MTRYGFVCLLLTSVAWGQAANPKPAPSAQQQTGQKSAAAAATAAQSAPQEAAETPKVAPNAPVITIKGVCDSSAAKSPALECRTEITRAEFEKVVEAVQPNMPVRARRQFASRYATILAMSIKAQEMGLDKGPDYEERMRLARMQVLANALNKEMQERASQITDKEIDDYYHKNVDKFEQAEMSRIYVPKTQQLPTEEEQKKPLSEAEQQKRAQEAEQAMKNEADKLRTRAASGEDFDKLQAEAFQVAGIKSPAPNTKLGKMRRNVLPPSQVSAMDLKPGEISAVIADQSGFFIYKLVSKETAPLDQAREEIRGTLRAEHLQNEMKALQESTASTLDEAYFGPETPPRGAVPPGAPGSSATPPKPTPPGPK
jgi:hypothetical protein